MIAAPAEGHAHVYALRDDGQPLLRDGVHSQQLPPRAGRVPPVLDAANYGVPSPQTWWYVQLRCTIKPSLSRRVPTPFALGSG